MNWDSVEKKKTLEQASQLIRLAHRPLLVCHVAPDGDALGSLVGLGRAIHHMGMRATLACADTVPSFFGFIPGVERIVCEVGGFFDLVVALDCSDLQRVGRLAQVPGFAEVPLLNIDHHVTNLHFGDVNLVDPQASSTAEIVLQLVENVGVEFDAQLATCLLTGIVADTRGFSTSNVTTHVMEAALKLMRAGASLPYVTQHSLNSRSTNTVFLWGLALAEAQVRDRLIWTSIPLSMRRRAGYLDNGDAGLTSFLVSAEDADVAAVFVEKENGQVEVGLRAVPGCDVAQVALQFGGGGHALAAGCRLAGTLDEAQARVLRALWASLDHGNCPSDSLVGQSSVGKDTNP